MHIPVPTPAFAVAKAETLHVSEHLFFYLYSRTVAPARAQGPHTEYTEDTGPQHHGQRLDPGGAGP